MVAEREAKLDSGSATVPLLGIKRLQGDERGRE